MCTACVIADGPRITAGKNFDFPTGKLPHTRATVDINAEGPLRYIGLLVNVQPGANAGLNEAGLGSMIMFCDDRKGVGEKEEVRSVVNHKILSSARTVIEGLAVLESHVSAHPEMSGGYFLLFDSTGQIAVVEQIRGDMRVYAQHGGTVYRTNHCFMFPGICSPEMRETRSTFLRYDRIGQLLRDREQRVSVKELTDFFADHENGPSERSICVHSESCHNTVASIVFSTQERVAWYRIRHPCGGDYTTMSL